jgi:hypothetical protein
MERQWLFLNNPFMRATSGSYEKAVTISTFTDARLAASPGLGTYYAFYHPLHTALINAYNAWKLGGGQQKTATASMAALLKGLTAAVNDWDFAIQSIARKGTPEYLTFFPQGHTPFITGKQDMRISAVATLSNALATVSPVPAVKTQVDSYLSQLNTANTTQEGKKGGTNGLSDAVEAMRVAACHGLYYVLAQLMALYYQNPEPIATYFDLELIRDRQQDDFTGSVQASAVKTIAKRTLEADDMILLKNTGLVPLTFYLAADKGAAPVVGAPSVIVPEGQHQNVPANALGDVAENKFLMVYNASELTEGNWEVEG